MDTATAFETVSGYLVEHFEVEPERISMETDLFKDLDLDSIDALDMLVMLETDIGMEIVEDDLKKIRTVQDVVKYVISHVPA